MPTPSALSKTLADVRKRIGQAGSKGLNEQNTKATLIEPVIRALGWDTEDLQQVEREFRVKPQHKPVDYGLLSLRTPRLLVEAKGLGQNLDDHKWANQIMGYAAVAGVEWIVLTDGDEYRIYNSHATVAVEEKLLRSVRISSGDALVEPTLDLLSKARLQENRLEVLWQAHFVDRAVKAAVEDLFAGENDMLLVNHVLKSAPKLTPKEVRASLRRCRSQFDFPVSPDDVLASVKTSSKTVGGKRTPPKVIGVSLADLISEGRLNAPVKLYCRYRDRDLTARILRDGTVEHAGKTYPSLSEAGGAARASVIGMSADGDLPATNGWAFWKYTARDGKTRHIDHARQEHLASLAQGEAKAPRTRAG